MLAELTAKKTAARSDLAIAEIAVNETAAAPRPPRFAAKAHDARIAAAKAARDQRTLEFDRADARVDEQINASAVHEAAYRDKIRLHRQTVVATNADGARRYLRVAARCRELIKSAPEILWLGAPALFAHGLTKDKNAKPNARWLVDTTGLSDEPAHENDPNRKP